MSLGEISQEKNKETEKKLGGEIKKKKYQEEKNQEKKKRKENISVKKNREKQIIFCKRISPKFSCHPFTSPEI
jgi:hypothetical protein